ncbi:MAG: response regulator [Verrucomicrobiota bacterium]
MPHELNILMLEDVANDAELVERELRKSDMSFRFNCVDEGNAFLDALTKAPPDVVLSDHGLPSFDGFAALASVRSRFPSVPFIFVTGALGEEGTIRAFENGATDCVLKHRLSDLVPTVKRALREAGEKKQLLHAEMERDRLAQELAEMKARLSALGRLMPICSSCNKIRDERNEWQRMEEYFLKQLGITFSHSLCPECVQKYYTGYGG